MDNKNIDLLKNIWQVHTEIQENILQLRSTPVIINPKSVKINGDKLYLQLDINDSLIRFKNNLQEVFQLNSIDLKIEDGYFFADKFNSKNISSEQRNDLVLSASSNFVTFFPNPIIDGEIRKFKPPITKLKNILNSNQIEYNFDRHGRLQISINSLKSLQEIIKGEDLDIKIPNQASCILKIYPNPLFFLKKKFPFLNVTHKSKPTRRGNKWKRTIEIKNGYFKDKIIDDLNEIIGLKPDAYEIIFHVNPEVISKYDPDRTGHILTHLNKDESRFIFRTSLKSRNEFFTTYEEEKSDYKRRFHRLKIAMNRIFGIKNVTFESKFIYSYDQYKFQNDFLPIANYNDNDFWKQVREAISGEKISVSDKFDSLGIDFNWKEEEIKDVLKELTTQCPIFNFHLFDNHRCNIDFKIKDKSLDEAEKTIQEKFPSIKIKNNFRQGFLYFYQEYQSPEQYFILKELIESELNSNEFENCTKKIFEVPENKEKYFLSIDYNAREEAQTSAIKNLKGTNFTVNNRHLGRLVRINFPELIFDISGENFEANKQLFETKTIDSVEPNLIGDIEKVYRLKAAMNSITFGYGLQNPNLADFIFDASKAAPTEDINNSISERSEIFKELSNHLLNKNINQSQKSAIIKSILAKDLALIQGPPGTGKSTAIAEIIWQHVRKNTKERILLTSETNLAVDNAIDRIVNNYNNLVKPIRIGSEEKLDIEGQQFSLVKMKEWVKNGYINSEENEDDEDSKTLPQKLILENWINNIRTRVDRNIINENTLKLWDGVLSNPSIEIREVFFENYKSHCNVIGATCSSIGKYNITLSDLIYEQSGNRVRIPTSFYKQYCETFGKKESYTNKEGLAKEKFKEVELSFSTVIQDESSKATPAELSLPLIYGKKNVVIGDHRQLPPLLDRDSFKSSFNYLLELTRTEEEYSKINKLKRFVEKNFKELEISHFERLFSRIDSSLKGVFNLQYRMHPDINEVIRQFYIEEGGLECGLINPIDLGVNEPNLNNPASRYHGIKIDNFISPENHVVWVDVNSPELLDGTSRVNYGEVEVIRSILLKFQKSDSYMDYQNFWDNPEDKQIGLISFYGKQIKLLKELKNDFNQIPLRISTVDRFQGMERNIIIVSMVRSNRIATDKSQKSDTTIYGELGYQEQFDLGFAQSPNRLNVALSRAKRLLIIVGNSQLFRQKNIYDNVYKTIAKNPNGLIINSHNQ